MAEPLGGTDVAPSVHPLPRGLSPRLAPIQRLRGSLIPPPYFRWSFLRLMRSHGFPGRQEKCVFRGAAGMVGMHEGTPPPPFLAAAGGTGGTGAPIHY